MAKYALLTPLYWGLMSIAAWKGFFQLITNPFYWEKTTHGLSDVQAAGPAAPAAPAAASARNAPGPAPAAPAARERELVGSGSGDATGGS